MMEFDSEHEGDAGAKPLKTNATSNRVVGLVLGLAAAVSVLCCVAVVGAAVFTGGLILSARPASVGLESVPSAGVTVQVDIDIVETPENTPSPKATATKNTQPTATPELTSEATSSPTTGNTKQQRLVFQQLWNAVNSRYVYPNFNGLDWAATKTEVEAKIDAGLSSEQFYDLMRVTVESLKDDHSAFLSPEEVKEEDQAYAGTKNYVGIGVLVEANKDKGYIYILQVYPNSPAAEAGLKPHDHILQIDGQSSVDKDGSPQDRLIRGDAGTEVTLVVRTPGSPEREITIVRGKVQAQEKVEYFMLPAKLAGRKKIGYIQVPTFFDQTIDGQMRDALRDLMRKNRNRLDGLVIDMRTNGGGAYPQLEAALGFFSSGTMGQLVNRDATVQDIVVRAERIGNSQTVPLAILISPATVSYAEVFSGALQAKRRAKLVGLPSAGNIETLYRHDFDDGSLAWIAEETFQLPDGSGWEGKGLQPDETVSVGWDEFTGDNDPVVAQAATLLK